ncbi:MAG: hypothetical protein ACO1NZ_16480 [Adhaeribacter sp.]
MKYSNYLEALDAVLQTAKSNLAIPDIKDQQLYPALQVKITAAGDLSEKQLNSIKEAQQALFALCRDSPLLAAGTSPSLLSPLFRQSGDAPDPDSLPLVLSGPLVRRAEPAAVTVWVALKSMETVSLSIFEDRDGSPGMLLLSGQQATVALGEHLFVTAVTASPASPGATPLEYGKSYLYELTFGNSQQTLTSLGLIPELTYAGYALPAFMLPPLEPNKLHLVHSSCRNITSDSYDTLPALDTLMAAEWKGLRPQQLFLSGDQIYADEANEVLEHLYISVGNTMMSSRDAQGQLSGTEKMRRQEEILPDLCPADIIPGERGHLHKVKEFKINNRNRSLMDLLKEEAGLPDYPPEYAGQADTADCIHDLCGFTPTSRFHLLALADFFGLYLLNWSGVLWPAFFRDGEVKKWAIEHSMAHKNEAEGNLMGGLEEAMGKLTGLEKHYIGKIREGEAANKARVEAAYALKQFRMVLNNFLEMMNLVIFASGLGQGRRVLANIASYMMFDDHEVTDDWHMTREWVHRVYSKPMGRRVLQNGLAAYAVFQAWGNTPGRFAPDQSGGKLLEALSTWIASGYTNEVSEQVIANALRIPDKSQVAKYRAIGPGDTFPEVFDRPLAWAYQVVHPRYEVLVLDARTFRSFPGSLYGAADHLSAKALQEQLPGPATLPAPFSDQPRELTFVISPCNVVTIPLFRNYLSQVALPLAHYFTGYKGNRWEMAAYDPDQADSWEAGTPMFENFLSRLARRIPTIQPNDKSVSRVVVLSGDVHFSYAGRLAYWADKPLGGTQEKAHEMVLAHLTASGMKNEAGAWKKLKLDLLGYEFTDLGSTATRLPEPEVMVGYAQAPATLDKTRQDEIVLRTRWFPNYKPGQITRKPLLLPAHKVHPDVKLPKPEWMYRMDFVRGSKEKAIENINTISHFHFAREQGPSSEIIRRSNFAAITLDWEGEGQLNAALDAKAETATLLPATGKVFPRPPFFVVIDTEILYVTETQVPETAGAEVTFKKLKRGRAGTTAAAHAAGAAVKVRPCVTQTNWLVAETPLKELSNPPTPPAGEAPGLVPAALTRFKVALAADDLQYAKPTLNTL